MGVRLLAVDLDGVLVDTFWIHQEAWVAVLEELGVAAKPEEFAHLRSVPTLDAMNAVLRLKGVDPSKVSVGSLATRKTRHRNRLLAQLRSIPLRACWKRRLWQAELIGCKVVCMATTSAAPQILRKAGLEGLLDDAIYGEALIPPKRQSPNRLLQKIRELDLRRTEALFVDDCDEAVNLALEAGVPAVFAGTGEMGEKGLGPALDLQQLYELGVQALG